MIRLFPVSVSDVSVTVAILWSLVGSVLSGACPASKIYFDLAENLIGANLPNPAEHIRSFMDLNPSLAKYINAPSFESHRTQCSKFEPQPPRIEDGDIRAAYMNALRETEQYRQVDSAARQGSGTMRENSELFIQSELESVFLERSTKSVQEQKCTTKKTTTIYLPSVQLEHFRGATPPTNLTNMRCESVAALRGHRSLPKCSRTYPFRTVDSTCNNLERPLEGRYSDCFQRLLPPDYQDGYLAIRVANDGAPLPNARIISTEILGGTEQRPLSLHYTQLHTSMGQILSHDIGSQPNTGLNVLRCCRRGDDRPITHPQCIPIPLPANGEIWELYGQTCMEVARSVPCSRCSLGPREMINAATTPFDLSFLYGVTDELAEDIRSGVNGTLAAQIDERGGEILELANGSDGVRQTDCFFGSGQVRLRSRCFRTGDGNRGTQNPEVTFWTLVFFRRHNLHARKLAELNRNWSDERIYQEARRILIGEYQNIIYQEYVHTIVGEKLMKFFDLWPQVNPSDRTQYDSKVQLATLLEFSTLAGRQGHATLHELVSVDLDPQTDLRQSFTLPLRDAFFYTELWYRGYTTGVGRGMMNRPAFQIVGATALKTHLLHTPNRTFGMDLGAIDIQRQRDHGMPSYAAYLKYCYNHDVFEWKDLKKFLSCERVEQLKQYYRSVLDVDAYVGGILEPPIANSVVGPTFACLIGIQYHNLKFGDRFYFEHADQSGSFGTSQLKQIRRSSLAEILCSVLPDLDKVLLRPLELYAKDSNPWIACSTFAPFNYKSWREGN